MENENLISWLTDSRSAEYFGPTFSIRAEVLAHLITGRGTLADIARRNRVSRQAVHRHSKLAKEIYGFSSTRG